jgi:hypothetical protein
LRTSYIIVIIRKTSITLLLTRNPSQFLNYNICRLNIVTFLLQNLRLSKIMSLTSVSQPQHSSHCHFCSPNPPCSCTNEVIPKLIEQSEMNLNVYKARGDEENVIATSKKVEDKVHLWVFQNLCLEGVLYSYPNEFLHSSPEALHTKRA